MVEWKIKLLKKAWKPIINYVLSVSSISDNSHTNESVNFIKAEIYKERSKLLAIPLQ